MHKEIKTLLAASLIFNLGVGMFGPLYAIFVVKVGGDILSASGAWAVFSLTTGILMILLGKVADRISRKKFMVFAGYGVMALGNLGFLFVENPLGLFIVEAILGIGSAITTPAWDAIFSKAIDKGREGFEWSLWSGSVNIVWAIAAMAGGIVVSVSGFRTLFILIFLLNVAAAAVVLTLPRSKSTFGRFA